MKKLIEYLHKNLLLTTIVALLLLIPVMTLVIFNSLWLHDNDSELTDPLITTSNIPSESSSGSTQKTYVIGISQANFSEPWRTVANLQYKTAVAAHPELKLILLDGRQDNNKQISDIQSLIDQKVDLIIASPNEALPLTPVISKAYHAGIPVILVDRKINSDAYTEYIGADNKQIGYLAGQWIVNYLGERGGNVVELTGSEGTSAQKERHDGFMSAIKSHPQIKVIDSQSTDWIFDKAIAVMEEILAKHNDIDVVYSHNDPGAEGAYRAALSAGRAGEMAFVGIDALPTKVGGIRSVMAGRLNVTYLYPTGSKEAIESAYQLLVQKQPIPKEITLDTLEITPQNASDVYFQLNQINQSP